MANGKPTYGLTIERMNFLDEALRHRSGWHLQDAVAFTERDERTVRRWVDELGKAHLNEEGLPGIYRVKRGRKTFIEARPEAFRPQADKFDYASVAFALQLVDFAKDTSLAKGLANVKIDLERELRLPPGLVANLGTRLFVRHTGPRLSADGEVLDEIISGILNTRRVRLKNADWAAPRVVEPLALAIFQAGVYVWVRSTTNPEHIYNLALQRIVEAEMLGVKERFVYPTHWNLSAIYATRFGYLPGDRVIKCALRFPPHTAPYIRERLWHASQKLETLRDGSVRLRIEVEDAPDFVAWICGFGDEVVVEQPKRLRDLVVGRLERALSAYRK